ncbi:MAG: homoserine dehydrogenase [Lachnospiraceae bacterium]|nr:homoserine dehydrogenase [Lachnospiraceae bacterium]
MKEQINVALLGLGTVGTGVYKILQMQKEDMIPKLGCTVQVKKILVRNIEKAAKKVEDPSVLTNDWNSIVNDPDIDIVVEVMGGLNPAGTYIREALQAGKNVVTANKDLIAAEGHELLQIAGELKKDLMFEAAVAGGIPLIRPLKQCLQGNHIETVMGIVNGTTNFILTKMTFEGMEFGEALALAQELGYAEADPTADIEGLDAARKVAIMSSLAFHTKVTFDDVYTEGITKITAKDIRYAKEMGCRIKLLGVAKDTPEGVEAAVYPMLVPEQHPLASVNDSFNAVFVHGDAVDDAMFYGRGAGELPTGSAIVGDIFDVVRNINWDCTGRIGCTCYKNLAIKDAKEVSNKYYIRLKCEDRFGVLAAVTSIFGCHKVSIEQMIQKRKTENTAELVVVTEAVKDKHMRASLEAISHLEVITEIASVIRVAE